MSQAASLQQKEDSINLSDLSQHEIDALISNDQNIKNQSQAPEEYFKDSDFYCAIQVSLNQDKNEDQIDLKQLDESVLKTT